LLDLLLRGGRVIDPAQDIDRIADVGFAAGRAARIEDHITEPAKDVRDVAGSIVSPGLIDLHTHVYWGGTSLGVDAEFISRRSGTTTLIDAGSAGPGNFHGFHKHVIENAPVRILAYLNISFPGIFAFSDQVMVGECTDLRLLSPTECVRVIRQHPDLIVGIKVRVGRLASGTSGVAPLDMALEVAEETGLPVMAHIDDPPPNRREVLKRLRPGDVLTHCFRPFPNAPVRGDGRIWEDVVLARERGVIFDIGHGGRSFGFAVARRMLEEGFVPDVISSDVHALSVDGPAFDLLATLSKFHCLGLDLPALVGAATINPARALRRADIGTLGAGAVADATVFDVEEGEFEYGDALGETMKGRHRLRLRGIVVGGSWWHP
jgi:dihydroorotase